VRRGVERALVSCDLPFGPVQEGVDRARKRVALPSRRARCRELVGSRSSLSRCLSSSTEWRTFENGRNVPIPDSCTAASSIAIRSPDRRGRETFRAEPAQMF
jgi:hypothetical protein